VSLGSTYEDSGDYLNALSAFKEARTINRRIYGLLDESQIPIMEEMTDTLYKMERIEDADQLQLDALQLAERNRGGSSPELVDAIYRYADWLGRTGRYLAERQQYARALEILRVSFGEDSPALATPLRGIGNSFRMQRLDEGQGLGALRRALQILESQADPDALALAEVLRDLGDWSVAFSRIGPTGNEYRRSWQLLGELQNAAALRNQWYRGPEFVLREPISQRGVSNEAGATPGFVLVQFDIDTMGRPENVVVLESNPPGFKDDAILRAIRRSRFRPQMRDGELVRGEKLALRFAFGYDPDDYPERS
jgi:TonB family protein